MKLGDAIAKFTGAVGIKTCEQCKGRQEFLNRRGFLGLGVLALGATRVGFWKLVRPALNAITESEPLPIGFAMALVRTLSIAEVTVRLHLKMSGYPDLQTLIDCPRHGIRSIQQSVAGNGSNIDFWMSKLNFGAEEIIPGWLLDLHIRDTGYIMIVTEKVSGPKNVIVTDETGIIYQAKVSEIPAAQDLAAAKHFPSAIPKKDFRQPIPSWRQRLLNAAFFPQTQPCWGTNGVCPQSGCMYCITQCCHLTCWNIAPPPPYGVCLFLCGDQNCIWVLSKERCSVDIPCPPSGSCAACAAHYATQCGCTCPN
jgi:hypothetical protein